MYVPLANGGKADFGGSIIVVGARLKSSPRSLIFTCFICDLMLFREPNPAASLLPIPLGIATMSAVVYLKVSIDKYSVQGLL